MKDLERAHEAAQEVLRRWPREGTLTEVMMGVMVEVMRAQRERSARAVEALASQRHSWHNYPLTIESAARAAVEIRREG